jgi:excisionase family DNA binding protein
MHPTPILPRRVTRLHTISRASQSRAVWAQDRRGTGPEGLLWSVEEEDTYSVSEAAKILQLTEGRIRQMLRAGELEGGPPDQSYGRGWRIPMRAVHAILEERRGRADAVADLLQRLKEPP